MAYKRGLGDDEITALLQSVLDDSSLSEAVSELENEVLTDDIQSDVEDVSIQINAVNNNIQPIQEELQGEDNSASTTFDRIIQVSQPTLRSKSRHCWTSSKGQNTCKTLATNIVRTARGPT